MQTVTSSASSKITINFHQFPKWIDVIVRKLVYKFSSVCAEVAILPH